MSEPLLDKETRRPHRHFRRRHRHGAGHGRLFTIVMAGNANVGKSSIFNQLTGLAQETGNWAGKTVGVTEGTLGHHGLQIKIVDLPGIYSLSAYAPEEKYTREYIFTHHPDVIINVLDATSLERNLFLTLQLKEMGVPVVIALNNTDVAEKKHINLDIRLLSEITGCPVVKTVAIKGIGVHEIIDAALELKSRVGADSVTLKYGPEIEKRIGQIMEKLDPALLKYPARWTAIQLLLGEKELFTADNEAVASLTALAQKLAQEIAGIHGEDIATVLAAERYALAADIARRVNLQPESVNKALSRLDNIILHPVFGYIKGVGNLLAVFFAPLARGDHCNAAIFIYISKAALGLEKSVFLRGSIQDGFNDHVGLLETGFDIAVDQLMMREYIAFKVGVE